MRILFCIIALAALAVGIWGIMKEEYIIAFIMFFVIALQISNFFNYKKNRHGR